MRFSQFGLDIKWHAMTKAALSSYKVAMRESGKPASSSPIFEVHWKLVIVTPII